MERTITDLELDIREIKYLLEVSGQKPDFLPIVRRRIEEMQNHLAELLVEVDAKNGTEFKEEIKPETNPETLADNEVEQNNEPETNNEPEMIVHVIEEETVTVEFAGEEPVEPDKTVEAEALSFHKESVLGERLRPSDDLIRSMSLNDAFRFSRELFDGDTEKMNKLLQQISEMDSFDNVMVLLDTRLNVNKEDECFLDFIELLRKYFA